MHILQKKHLNYTKITLKKLSVSLPDVKLVSKITA